MREIDYDRVDGRTLARILTKREKGAIIARMFGAGDIVVAKQLGRYPVPHDALDAAERLLRGVAGGWEAC